MATLRRSILVSALFTMFGGPVLLMVLVPWLLTGFHLSSRTPPWQRIAAGLLIAAGLIPLLESIARFVVVGRGSLVPAVPTERLVVSGLYGWVRNPMYAGVLTVVAGEALLFRSARLVLYCAFLWVGFHLFVRFYEERHLARAFGAEFDAYCRNVPRWRPRLRPWRGDF